jgi:hypothetical protein
MSHPLKELLERMMESDGVELHADCDVEQDVAGMQTRLSDLPTAESADERIFEFALKHLRGAAKSMAKNARKQELELEMRLLDKPDEVDLSSEDYSHARLHVEQDTLRAEIQKREAVALLRFCDLVESLLPDD